MWPAQSKSEFITEKKQRFWPARTAAIHKERYELACRQKQQWHQEFAKWSKQKRETEGNSDGYKLLNIHFTEDATYE